MFSLKEYGCFTYLSNDWTCEVANARSDLRQ